MTIFAKMKTESYSIAYFSLFLMIVFVLSISISGCESPTSPHKERPKQTIEIRNNSGLR